jgi:acyl-CoA thioesterase
MSEGAGIDAALSLQDLAAGLVADGDGYALHGAAGWLQGRTMYGGASSFIAYTAARRAFPDLPPLRAAQIGFVGPVGEDVQARVTMLRSGKSVSHVETTLVCNDALVHRAVWLFGSARLGNGTVEPARLDGLEPPEAGEQLQPLSPEMVFIKRMEIRRASPDAPPGRTGWRRWVRLRDRTGLDLTAEMIAIGDTLPPGSARAMERRGPISSINWAFTLLGDPQPSRDGWYLLETASNHMADGFGSETLTMWNADGIEVMRGLQSVAIFG